jgi:thymidine kinase
VPQLLALAEYITKTLAICVLCGNPANRTQRVGVASGRIVVGSTDLYEARCRRCFVAPEVPEARPAGRREETRGGDAR